MGESGKQRSTLVSRLPIFRRSSSKKHHHHHTQESLPSSPSSGTNVGVDGGNGGANGNGVHTSSPSSTNSSTSSTGKRRSLFRTPSLSFHKRSSPASEPRLPANDPLADPQSGAESLGQDGGSSGGGGHVKSRHSFGFGGSRHKKITRSQTEDFEKGSSTSSSGTNRNNVFINCISSGTVEGDDSGFLDDVSGSSAKRSSSKHRKHLLPKSFSAHHRFSRNQAPETPPETQTKPSAEGTSGPGTPGSWPGELAVESSLQSPILSEDRTTAITPSEFVHVTEDSVSEVDALPPPSPAAPPDVPGLLGGVSALPASAPTSSQVQPSVPPELASEPTSLPTQTNASATVSAQCESQTTAATTATNATAIAAATATATAVVPATTAADTGPEEAQSQAETQPDVSEVSESEPDTGALEPELSEEGSSNPEPRERRLKNPLLAQDARKTSRLDTRQGHLRKPNTVSLCSSVSPYHEVMRLERRLRSASEGAGESSGSGGGGGGGGHGGGGGRRLHLSLREPHSCALETIGLHKRQRTHSSSSKLGSLDVLNNLGSSELDEDDLMLDLDLSDDQRHRHVSREDSSLSLGSCLNLMASPLEHGSDRLPGETSHRELRSLSLLGRDEDLPGLESLPLRLMQQDCTAVKTLLLRLRRTLQESTDISPASSLHSLPISPCSEKSLPFKEPVKEEAQTTSTTLSNASLLQQLKEKDELIQRLQAELERLQAVQKSPCQKADRCTQTDTSLPEVLHPGRAPGQSSITSHHSSSHSSISISTISSIGSQRERRGLRPPTADLYSRPPPSPLCEPPCRPSPSPLCDPPCCPGGGGGGGGGGEGGRGGGRDAGSLSLAPGRKGTSCDSTTMTQPLTMTTTTDSMTERPQRRWEHPPTSQIPRAIASSTSSLPGRASPSCSQSSDSERGPRSERSPLAYHHHHHYHHHTSTPMPTAAPDAIATPAATTTTSCSSVSSAVSTSSGVVTGGSVGGSSSFAGRLGQPPRGPLSLHMYSRKNVFLQHSLHTAELQALAHQDG